MAQTNTDEILGSLLARSAPDGAIDTAGRFLRGLSACVSGDGPCSWEAFGVKSAEELATLLKDHDKRLIFTPKDGFIEDIATKGAALSPGSVMDFDAVITTSSRDRDEDELVTSGANLDLRSPLLLFHDANMPVGRLVSKGRHTKQELCGRFSILNTALGRDAAVLVQGGALRISHGFDPVEYEPLKGGRYKILKFNIYEVSLVPIPSNPEAVILSWEKQKLSHPFVKSWAKSIFDSRPAQAPGVTFEKHDCRCGGKCDECQKSVRHEGESLQDCVSRKIGILVGEGREQSQAEAIAYSMCGEGKSKEQAIADYEAEQAVIKAAVEKLNPLAENPMDATIGRKDVADQDIPARVENHRGRGQGSQAGNVDWPDRHSADTVQETMLGNGVDNFTPGNTAQDATLAIATGAMTGGGRNPAPDTGLADTPGTANQPTPEAIDNRETTKPTPRNDWDIATGKAKKDVHDSSFVQPSMSDGPEHHSVDENIAEDVKVDVPGLKSMARKVKHSGKEGNVYLHPESGHVHHVMHPQDLHPDNEHLYHQPHEIEKMYASVRGVSGVKTAISHHPAKGSGYKLVHKSAATRDSGANDMGEIENGDGNITSTLAACLKSCEDHLKALYAAPEDHVSPFAKAFLVEAGKALVQAMKFNSDNPNGDGMPSVPADDAAGAQTAEGLSGVPAANAGGAQTASKLEGTPAANEHHAFHSQTPAVPNGKKTDPEISNAPDGAIGNETASHESEVMKWLESGEQFDADGEFDALVAQATLEADIDSFLTV